MRQSREFDNVLDECLERLLVRGETIEQCLQSFPQHRDELKPLLETALATRQASAVQPRPEFRDRARYQLYSALHEIERKRSRPLLVRQLRWATVVAVVLALLLAGGGTVAAAGGSMPDEPLYPVKLATEQVRLVLTPSALGKAELYARLADRRVIEIARMADENKPEQIERAARRFDAHLSKIADLASVQVAPAFKEGLAPRETPAPKARPTAEEAPLLPERAKAWKGADIKVERRARLRAMMLRHADNHPGRLRALLKTAPPSARPALLRAITVSEAGYKKALESLDEP